MKQKILLWIQRLAFPVFLLAILGFIIWHAPALWDFFKDQEKVKAWITHWGILAPLVFVGLQFMQVVIFIIPGEVTQIAGGYLFGFFWGTIYSLIGIVIGSCFNFYVARLLGLSFVHAITGPDQIKKFDHLMASPKLIGTFFFLFLIPGLPKDILCYVAGLSRLKFLPFLVLTTIARLPGILGSSLLGRLLAHGQWIYLIAVILIVAGLFLLGWFHKEKIMSIISRYAVEPEEHEE